jgi:hypothetical protein
MWVNADCFTDRIVLSDVKSCDTDILFWKFLSKGKDKDVPHA